MKVITYTAGARRSLNKLPAQLRSRIAAKLSEYAVTGAGDVKALVGRAGARLRIGDYRVIFIETASTIDVVAVGHRRDIYR